MNAAEVAATVLEALPDSLYVSSLGTATSALRSASGDGPHLYLGGSMGSALAVALGVAETRPERGVVALLGDGELLMRAGALWSLAGARPPNLLVVVLSNRTYGITGGQPVGVPAAFAGVASALGLAAASAETAADLARHVLELGRPGVVDVLVDDPAWPGPSPFVDPPVVRSRFEEAAARGSANV